MCAEAVPLTVHAGTPGPQDVQRLLKRLADNVETALRGKREVIELALCALLARGHLLIEDVPGVGKTTLAQALARSFDLAFSRIQFTSDLLPSDIVGAEVFDARSASFSFRPGPIFAQVVLADELNRAPPRTQSALLEAMADAQVSLDGRTHPLPRPFVVIATQNPREQSGTYPLPDSQLDRFLLRLSIGHPDSQVEKSLLLTRLGDDPVHAVHPVASATDLTALQGAVAAVKVDPALAEYAVLLVQATRASPLLAAGASTRGALFLMAAAKAWAVVDGRSFLLPDDIQRVAVAVLAHRVAPAGRDASDVDRGEAERVVREIVARVEVPE